MKTTTPKRQKRTIILGSSSQYRKTLLARLNLSFKCQSPNIDETPFHNERAQDLVKRLSVAKALAVHNDSHTDKNAADNIIITSDQVATLNGEILGKPLTEEKALKQLSKFSGNKVGFLTGLCVFDQSTQSYQYSLDEYYVHFRKLSEDEIKRYIVLEQPLDCAGSFKCEGLGVTLFSKMEGNDPNSLIGLPLISLCRLLRELDINPLS